MHWYRSALTCFWGIHLVPLVLSPEARRFIQLLDTDSNGSISVFGHIFDRSQRVISDVFGCFLGLKRGTLSLKRMVQKHLPGW